MSLEKSNHEIVDWDECFMRMAHVISWRSKDPNTQVGAVVVSNDNIVIGLGYNGFPRHSNDKDFPWDREGDFLETKYPYVVHAEENAVYNSNANTRDSRIYCLLFPCNECAKTIIQSGIKEVVFEYDKYPDDEIFIAAKKLFDSAGVKYRQYQSAWAVKKPSAKNEKKLKIKMLDDNAIVPEFAREGDAGLDLFAIAGIDVAPGERVKIPTGIAMEIPEGFVGLIWDRTGVSLKKGLKIIGGVVDSSFRGEVQVLMANISDDAVTIVPGDKIAQMLIQPFERPQIEVTDELSETERGDKMFGSSDSKKRDGDFVKLDQILSQKEKELKEENGAQKGRW